MNIFRVKRAFASPGGYQEECDYRHSPLSERDLLALYRKGYQVVVDVIDAESEIKRLERLCQDDPAPQMSTHSTCVDTIYHVSREMAQMEIQKIKSLL